MMAYVFVIAGLGLLFAGGEALVRAAVSLAQRFHLSPLIIGLTIVAYGTSAPELVISIMASLKGLDAIALGNVIGSNIANVLLVLGTSALIYPMVTERALALREGVFVAAVTLLLCVFALSGVLHGWHGGVLLALLAGYTFFALRRARRERRSAMARELEHEVAASGSVLPLWQAAGLLVIGVAALVIGSDLLVDGASEIALALGVPERVIAVTIVAVGGSSPELATSVVAALRRHNDIAIGNVLGSNLFNIVGVLGISALIHPMAVDPAFLVRDLWVMLATAAALVLVMLSGGRLDRFEGGAFLLAYAAYLVVTAIGI